MHLTIIILYMHVHRRQTPHTVQVEKFEGGKFRAIQDFVSFKFRG